MSLKSLIQLVILITIFIILGGVYFKYFAKEKISVTQTPQITQKENSKNLQQKNQNNNKAELEELSDEEKSKQEINVDTNQDDLIIAQKEKTNTANIKPKVVE